MTCKIKTENKKSGDNINVANLGIIIKMGEHTENSVLLHMRNYLL